MTRIFMLVWSVSVFAYLVPNLIAADDVESKTAIVGFATNVRSFDCYGVTYELAKGKATSFEDGFAGKWTDKHKSSLEYRVNRTYESLEANSPRTPIAKPPANHKKGTVYYVEQKEYLAGKFLLAPQFHARYVPEFEQLEVMSYQKVPESDLYDLYTPLSHLFFGRRFEMAPDFMSKDPSCQQTNLGRTTIDGKSLVGVRFKPTQPISREMECYFDPSQGYLCTHMIAKENQNSATIKVRETIKTADGRWFPKSIIMVSEQRFPNVPLSYFCIELTVNELSLNCPGEDEIALKFPAGTRVVKEDKDGQIRLSKDEIISARQLDVLYGKIVEDGGKSIYDPTIPPATKPWYLRWQFLTAIGILLLLILRQTVRILRRK